MSCQQKKPQVTDLKAEVEDNQERPEHHGDSSRRDKKIKTRKRGKRKIDKEKENEIHTQWLDNVNKWKQIINSNPSVNSARQKQQQDLQRKVERKKEENSEVYYGDKLSVSDRWPNYTKEDYVRIYGQNVNGISYTNDYAEWEIALDHLHNKQVDVACFSEINLATEKPEVKYALIEKAKKLDKNIKVNLTCSKTNTSGSIAKRGGVAVITRGNLAGRIVDSGNDKHGRWTYITMVGKKNKCITIFSIYRVCDQKHQSGNCTVYLQQEHDLKASNRRDYEPREAILHDLTIQISKEKMKGHHIIVIGDINDDLNKKTRIDEFLDANELYNAIKVKHDGPHPATYDRGRKCLDLIACSNSIPSEAIEKCGYLAFYDGIFSDHRGSYIDLKLKFLFDAQLQDVTKNTFKRFSTSQVLKCEKYINQLVSYIEEAKIVEKIEKLQKDILTYQQQGKGKKEVLIRRSQTLFNKTTQLMIASEKRTGRKKKKQGYPSSQFLRNAGDEVVQIRKSIRKENIARPRDKYKLILLTKQLLEKKKALKEAQKNSKQHRREDLNRLANKRADEWNIKATNAIIVIKNSEESKKNHNKQRAFLKPRNSGGISQIYVPTPTTQHEIKESDITNSKVQSVVADPKEIFNVLLRQNYRDLLKSKDSVFSQGHFAASMGDSMESRIINDLLRGTHKLDENTKQEQKEYGDTFCNFVSALMSPNLDSKGEVRVYDWHFGADEYKEIMRKTKEKTACGPSGIHMSHWKAGAENETLAKVHSFFIWSAFFLGHSYQRWETSWHCMLQKKSFPFSQKLRIIQLFEGDLNIGLKYIIGRKLMWYLHDNRLMSDEIFGSRKGKTGAEALILLQLLADHSRIWKKNLAILFNDAAGCYDRIPHNLAEYSLRRAGCPREVTKMHTTVLQNMKHHIRTAVGVSIGFIKYDKRVKKIIKNGAISVLTGMIGGVGQGGGASPIIWTTVLMILLQAYQSSQQGATIVDYIMKTTLLLYIISYVDDNTIVRHFSPQYSTKEILEEMKSSLQEWQKLLQLTGGDLCLEKCKVTVQKWKQEGEWGKIIWERKNKDEETINIQSIKSGSKQEKLGRLDPDQAERVLGVRIPLSGSMSSELRFRKKNLKTFCTKFFNAPLSTYEAHLAYQTRYKPISTYPYPVTSFTSSELEAIQKCCIPLLLPKLGINRNMPRCVVFGPRKIGGRQIIDQKIEQPTLHFKTTLGHMRREGKVKEALYATLHDTQIEAGVKQPFFKRNPNELSYCTSNTRWMYTWNFIWEYKLQLEITTIWTPSSKYSNDQCIMDVAISDSKYRGKNSYKLQTINQCRLYQQAFFISDLQMPNSDQLNKHYLDGSEQHLHHSINFPPSLKPTELQWNEWKSFIFRNFLAKGYTITPPLIESQVKTNTPFLSNEIDGLSKVPCSSSILQIVESLPPELHSIMGNIKEIQMIDQLHESLCENNLFGTCDGSLIRSNPTSRGSHAYSLMHPSLNQCRIIGSSSTPSTTNITSLTTEMYGLLCTTLLVFCLCKYDKATIPSNITVQIYCDNKQAVTMCSNKNPCLNISETLQAEYDLQLLIQQVAQACYVNIEFQWIKGHQDELKCGTKIYGPFSKVVQANIDMDKFASTAASKSEHTFIKRPTFNTTKMSIYNEANEYVTDLQEQLTTNLRHNDLWLYLMRKNKWNEEIMKTIHWTALETTLQKYQPQYQTKIMQLMHDWQYTGDRKILFKDGDGKCPMNCGATENKLHYIWCKDTTFLNIKLKHLNLFQSQARAINTYPGIITVLAKILLHGFDTSWINSLKVNSRIDALLLNTIHLQKQLGPNSLPKGYILHRWEEIQLKWLLSSHTNTRSIHSWTPHIIRALHTYSYSLWKERNEYLHKKNEKPKREKRKQQLQERIASLYSRGRANLTDKEKKYFKLPLEIRQKKGLENMALWIKIVEAIFRRRGQARQELIDSWLTTSTPVKNWKDKYKDNNT